MSAKSPSHSLTVHLVNRSQLYRSHPAFYANTASYFTVTINGTKWGSIFVQRKVIRIAKFIANRTLALLLTAALAIASASELTSVRAVQASPSSLLTFKSGQNKVTD